MRLNDFCRDARTASGLTISQLETRAGLCHPVVKRYEELDSGGPLHAMLTALDVLGFDIVIRRRGDG